MKNEREKKRAGAWFSSFCVVAAVSALPLGCGGDDKFAAETDDEYTEQLTNAVIGTPDGVITIPSQAGAAPGVSKGSAGGAGGGGPVSSSGGASTSAGGGTIIGEG